MISSYKITPHIRLAFKKANKTKQQLIFFAFFDNSKHSLEILLIIIFIIIFIKDANKIKITLLINTVFAKIVIGKNKAIKKNITAKNSSNLTISSELKADNKPLHEYL